MTTATADMIMGTYPKTALSTERRACRYSPQRSMKKLIDIVAKLRSPEGCPWDRQQDHLSLVPFLLEESWEVVDEIKDNRLHETLKEELGDLLLQVVMHAQIATESGRFTIQEVVDGISEKLVARHPHVFKERKEISSEDQIRQWHRKKAESSNSVLDGVSDTMPALMASLKFGQRASSIGFDWESPADVLSKVEEELEEVSREMKNNDTARIEEEIGDLLFSIANLARFYDIDPEVALRKGNRKFKERFLSLERHIRKAEENGETLSTKQLDGLWNSDKKRDPR